MSKEPPAGTLGDLLASHRRRRFVGRAAEIELFRTALEAPENWFSVLYLFGPGGIGKTSLLEAFAELASDTEATVVRLDGRDLPHSPQAVLAELRAVLDVPDADAPIPPPPGKLVLLFDGYEHVAALDEWVRTRLLPRLPTTALTVIAGRTPPSPGWRADPAWRDLLRVVSLRNFSPEESRRYLRESGVDEVVLDRCTKVSHGHPLGLSLLADLAAHQETTTFDPLTPDLVGTLLRRFVDVVPNDLERRALEVCALARVTTEPLLRHALDLDHAHELFVWLRERSFVAAGPDGLSPHDLARDALDVDLRWRDLESYKRVFRRVRSHIYDCLKTSRGHEQQRVIFDLKFVFRNLPSVLSPVDWDAWGQHYPEPARAEDHDAILELVAAAEGRESAAIAEGWLHRQPEGFFVLRDGSIRGVLGLLDLTRATAQDRAADPGAQTAWDQAQRHRPARQGERVTQTRFVIDRDAYQDPSPTLNAAPIVTIQRFLQMPNLAWDFLTLAEPEPWDDYFALADMPRAVDADFVVGNRRYGMYGHDFRQVPIDALVEFWTERALAMDFVDPPVRPPEALVLSQPDFADAVRQALRDLGRSDLLARNPLLRTRLLRQRAGAAEPDAVVLEGLLKQAIDLLREHPRDDKLLRAVEATYVRPTRTQEAAAAVLGLAFSTYRRHLTRGVARIVSWLWDLEVYGGDVR